MHMKVAAWRWGWRSAAFRSVVAPA